MTAARSCGTCRSGLFPRLAPAGRCVYLVLLPACLPVEPLRLPVWREDGAQCRTWAPRAITTAPSPDQLAADFVRVCEGPRARTP